VDYLHFAAELPGLYENWAQLSVQPKSRRFHVVLERIYGMTTINVLQLLNFAVSCLEEGEAYAEVGCFRGATLVGALLGHPTRRALAVDNFSEFDPHGDNHVVLRQNLTAFGTERQVEFHAQNFEEYFLQLRSETPRIGVYLYDGAHDYRSQMMGLLLAVPLLADRALLIVDDSNFPAVKQATWDFLTIRRECRLLFDLPTPGNGHSSFWNGVYVLAWDRASRSNYEWPTLQAARQPALLESLDALQLVHLQKRDNSIVMVKAQ